MPILTAIDVLGIQRYVFSSNRLRDVVSKSRLVEKTTEIDRQKLEGTRGEILFAGGGNAYLLFPDIATAKRFAARHSRTLFDEAPGLETAIVHREYESGRLAEAWQTIGTDLKVRKLRRNPSAPLLGLGVTARCRETGLPAAVLDEFGTPLSFEIDVARKAFEDADLCWKSFLPSGHAFPRELDDMGRSRGDTSLLGVVHVDGNGFGGMIDAWLRDRVEASQPDDDVMSECRTWSESIRTMMHGALRGLVARVIARIEQPDLQGKRYRLRGDPEELSFDLKTDANDNVLLPFRPILLGGDDLTFVCDGRIALDLAAAALDALDGKTLPHLAGNLSACAGVALERVHHPFHRSYELAEKLCRSTKQWRTSKEYDGSALDWHLGPAGAWEPVGALREKVFEGQADALTCRPYPLKRNETHLSWEWLSGTLLGSGNEGLRGAVWSEKRNKAKTLPELCAEGKDAVSSSLAAWGVFTPELALPQEIAEGWFQNGKTPLCDAVELLDIHLSLAQGGTH